MQRNKKLYSGQYWSKKNQKHVFYESSYEYRAIRILESNNFVVSFSRCNLSLPVSVIDRIKCNTFYYNPDFNVVFANGQEYIIEVKARGLLGDFFVKNKLIAGFDLTKYVDIGYIVWTENELGIRLGTRGKKEFREWYFKETGKKQPEKKVPPKREKNL